MSAGWACVFEDVGREDSEVDDAGTKAILLRLMPAPKTRWSWSGMW